MTSAEPNPPTWRVYSDEPSAAEPVTTPQNELAAVAGFVQELIDLATGNPSQPATVPARLPVLPEPELLPATAYPVAPPGVADDELYRAWLTTMTVGMTADNPLEFRVGANNLIKSGRWDIPPHIRLSGGFGSIKLDCRMATPLTTVILVEVNAGNIGNTFGNVYLILPPGWAARTDHLARGSGTYKVEVAEVPQPGCPLIICRGQLGFGSFVIRYPTQREDRKLAKQLARQGELLR